jgi:hypothetical protein
MRAVRLGAGDETNTLDNPAKAVWSWIQQITSAMLLFVFKKDGGPFQ